MIYRIRQYAFTIYCFINRLQKASTSSFDQLGLALIKKALETALAMRQS